MMVFGPTGCIRRTRGGWGSCCIFRREKQRPRAAAAPSLVDSFYENPCPGDPFLPRRTTRRAYLNYVTYSAPASSSPFPLHSAPCLLDSFLPRSIPFFSLSILTYFRIEITPSSLCPTLSIIYPHNQISDSTLPALPNLLYGVPT